jgi:hypothetical protein
MTVKFDYPVRVNMPVTIGPYAFRDAVTNLPINLLTDFSVNEVKCELKLGGTSYSVADVLTGSIVVAADGTVKVSSHTFTAIGTWMYQFYCTDLSGNKLWGEPVQFEVVKNVEDASTNEILRD